MELSYELSSYKPKNQEALQSFLSKAKETMDAGALKTAAYSGGILEGLVVSPQYATLGANWIGNKLGLRNDAEAVNAAKDIKQFYKEYSPIPKPVEDYFNFLQEQEPGLKDTGKIVGAAAAPVSRLGAAIGASKTLTRLPIKNYKLSPAQAAQEAQKFVTEPYIDYGTSN